LKSKWTKPQKEKLRDLLSSPIINKSTRMRWAGKISRVGRNWNFGHGCGGTSWRNWM